MTDYTEEVLRAAIAHLLPAHPSEGCGAIVRERAGGSRFVAMENVADRYHASDPAAFPRSSRDSYLFHPRAQVALFDEVEAGVIELQAIVHSHCDVGAYFSTKDRDDALGGTSDRPLFPGVEYLVVSVRGGEAGPFADDLRGYLWRAGAWTERILPLPR